MNARISTAKRLLTRYGKKLEQVVQKYKEEGLESLHAELSGDQKINRGNLRQLEEAVGAIDSLVGQLESSLSSFLTLRDSSPPSGTEPDDTDTYSIRAEECLVTAVEYRMLLQARIRAIKSCDSMFQPQQLRQKGEQVDSQWMVKKILSKFPEEFQRKVLLRKRLLPSNLQPISMEVLFDLMEDVLSGEEMIQVHLEKPLKTVQSGLGAQRTAPSSKKRTLPCMYCKGDHKPAACKKFKTPQERAQYLRERNLCQLCASEHHATAECSRQPCFYCQGPHHTSCCFKPGTNSTSIS
ncbi:hypothetical protein OSTOST_16863, partial [Ostertagia ostertagi]